MKSKSLSALNKQIEKENEIFNQMSNEEKRVAIAKDCIQRIKFNQLKAQTGSLIDIKPFFILDDNDSVKEILNTNKTLANCEICAKGGLFLSYVGRVNECTVEELKHGCSNNIDGFEHQRLLEIFSKEQLALIEFAFEGALFMPKEITLTKKEILNTAVWFVNHGGEYECTDNDMTELKAMVEKEEPRYFDVAKYPTKDTTDFRLIAICKNIIRNKGTFKIPNTNKNTKIKNNEILS